MAEENESPTKQLADFIINWKPSRPPIQAIREAKRALTDLLGVTIAGSKTSPSEITADFVRNEIDDGPAVVIGHGFRTSALLAALANGTTAHALDYDDFGKIGFIGHPTVCVVPAALAAAEVAGSSGMEFIEAIIVGFELVTRIGCSAGGADSDAYKRGYHGTSLFGLFGATAAASRLLGLNVEQAQHAIGIAASGPKGIRTNYGTDTKPLHAGEANRAGYQAAMLARMGITASSSALESRFGWADAVSSGTHDPQKWTQDLGTSLAIATGPTNFKRFPSCGASAPAVRAVLDARTRYNLDPSDIQQLDVSIFEQTLSETLIVPWPNHGFEGKFSLLYTTAAALADGRVVVSSFTDEKVRELESVRSRINVIPSSDRTKVEVRVLTNDGREFRTSQPTGHTDRPSGIDGVSIDAGVDGAGELPEMTDDDLRQKFKENVLECRSAAFADRLLVVLDEIEHMPSLRELTELLL